MSWIAMIYGLFDMTSLGCCMYTFDMIIYGIIK